MANTKQKDQLICVGAGLPRTGTESMSKALTMLGFKPYHMKDNLSYHDSNTWRKIMDTGASVNDNIMAKRGYTASLDWPASYFWEQQMEENPSAKIVLTTRTPESWVRSVMFTVFSDYCPARGWPFWFFMWSLFGLHYEMEKKFFAPDKWCLKDPEALKRGFIRHNEKVVNTVPKERLLVYPVGSGWEPLCTFLDVPIPDVPYPRSNSKADILQKFKFFYYLCALFNLSLAFSFCMLGYFFATGTEIPTTLGSILKVAYGLIALGLALHYTTPYWFPIMMGDNKTKKL